MNLGKIETVRRVYGGDYNLFLSDQRIKSGARYERFKMMCEENPEVYEAFREKIKIQNDKRKLDPKYKEYNRECQKKYYNRTIKKKEPTIEELAQTALKMKQKQKAYYESMPVAQKEKYKKNAKAKRDAMTPEQKAEKAKQKQQWYQKRKMERLNEKTASNA